MQFCFSQVWFQNARAKWRRNMTRQEGNGMSGGNVGACPGTPASSSTGVGSPGIVSNSGLLVDSNSMPSTSIEEMHSHHHLHMEQVSFSMTFT